MFDEPTKQKRRTYKRPSLLDHVALSDGRLAWPVAQAAGMPEATFRSRLEKWGADRAVSEPYQPQDKLAIAEKRQARAERQAEFLKSRAEALAARGAPAHWPGRLNLLHDAYGGVIWSDDEIRLAVSPKGRFYNVQTNGYSRGWIDQFRAREASELRDWLAFMAEDPPPELVAAADRVPNDPASCDAVPHSPRRR